jgi:Nucleotidyltransferase domain
MVASRPGLPSGSDRLSSAELTGWQARAIADLLPSLRERLPLGARFGVTGSAATGTVDRLSDLDLIAITADLPDAAGDLEMVSAAGPVWSIDSQAGEGGRTLRMVYADGRRIDLLLRAGAVDLPEPVRWLDAGSEPGGLSSDLRPARPEPVREEVFAVRHVAALAAAKLGRRDLLIGAHLCLDVARQSLVLSMQLRDREEGRTHHPTGSHRDRDAVRVAGALGTLPADAQARDWIDLLMRLTAVFDAAAMALWPDHRPDWQGLDAIVVAARTALDDTTE